MLYACDCLEWLTCDLSDWLFSCSLALRVGSCAVLMPFKILGRCAIASSSLSCGQNYYTAFASGDVLFSETFQLLDCTFCGVCDEVICQGWPRSSQAQSNAAPLVQTGCPHLLPELALLPSSCHTCYSWTSWSVGKLVKAMASHCDRRKRPHSVAYLYFSSIFEESCFSDGGCH